MTVAELSERITAAELIEWMAHDELTFAEREAARERAALKAKASAAARRR